MSVNMIYFVALFQLVVNIVIVTQRAPPFVFVLDATAIIMEVMIDILSMKDFKLILQFVISCYISRN